MTAKEFCKQVLPLQDKIFRLAKKFFNSVDDADDAVQEVFHKLWTRKEDIDSFKSLEAFALIVTRNHCLDTIKAKKHHVTQLNVEHDIADSTSQQKNFENKDELVTVFKLLNELPELQRTIFHLRDVEGLEFDDIAEILTMNPVTVRVNLSRARKFIREKMIAIQNYEYKRD